MPGGKAAAVVLGLGQNGLATVRALGRAGVTVLGVDENCAQPTAQSRYCERIVCPGFREGGATLLHALEDLGRRLPEPAVLFPSGDMSLLLVSEQRERLARYFRFRLPDRETVRLVLDKAAFQRFGEAHGIPLPRTVTVHPDLDVEREGPVGVRHVRERRDPMRCALHGRDASRHLRAGLGPARQLRLDRLRPWRGRRRT